MWSKNSEYSVQELSTRKSTLLSVLSCIIISLSLSSLLMHSWYFYRHLDARELSSEAPRHQSQGSIDHSSLTPLHLLKLSKNQTVTWQGLNKILIMHSCKIQLSVTLHIELFLRGWPLAEAWLSFTCKVRKWNTGSWIVSVMKPSSTIFKVLHLYETRYF